MLTETVFGHPTRRQHQRAGGKVLSVVPDHFFCNLGEFLELAVLALFFGG